MPKRVLSVGQCGPDNGAIRQMIEGNFDAQVSTTDHQEDTLAALRAQDVDLVLINRKLDIDYSDGLTIIEAIKNDPELADVPVMLITNYPEHQQLAQAKGAEPGFGKTMLRHPETQELLAKYLTS